MAKILRVVALVSVITLLTTAAAAVLIIGGGTMGMQNNNQATAQQQIGNQTATGNQTRVNPEFDARLTGASEVPPVQTDASGYTDLDVEREDGQRVVDYHLYITNIEGVTQGHIHRGTSSENGPVVVSLFNASTPTTPVPGGQVAEGHITSADLMGPLQGMQLDDLIALMQNGTAYVNVHTEQNPEGEIRGTVQLDIEDDDFEGGEEDDDDNEGEEGEGEDEDEGEEEN
jgi:hypothetical protein